MYSKTILGLVTDLLQPPPNNKNTVLNALRSQVAQKLLIVLLLCIMPHPSNTQGQIN